jgi:hypothetical protein
VNQNQEGDVALSVGETRQARSGDTGASARKPYPCTVSEAWWEDNVNRTETAMQCCTVARSCTVARTGPGVERPAQPRATTGAVGAESTLATRLPHADNGSRGSLSGSEASADVRPGCRHGGRSVS